MKKAFFIQDYKQAQAFIVSRRMPGNIEPAATFYYNKGVAKRIIRGCADEFRDKMNKLTTNN